MQRLSNTQVASHVLDPRKGNLGSIGVALVSAAKKTNSTGKEQA